MKSQRRHDLRTNALAHGLEQMPDLWRQYGTRILLIAIFLALALVLIYQRVSAARSGNDVVQGELAGVQQMVRDLRDPSLFAASAKELPQVPERMLAQAAEADRLIQQVLAKSDTPELAAATLVTQGNLHWAMANLPDFSAAAATRPTSQPAHTTPPDRNEPLKQAELVYQQVIKGYPQQTMAVSEARLGLAAIAENRKDWAGAAKLYDEVINDPQALTAYKSLATQRKDELAQVQQPVWIAPASTQPSALLAPEDLPAEPAGPAAPAPAVPAAAPTTAPAAPTTAPTPAS